MINISAAALALCEVLLKALLEANRLDGTMSYQQHAFGKIADALVETIACAIADSQIIFFGDARDTAKAIYGQCLHSGITVEESIKALNEGIYDKDFRI